MAELFMLLAGHCLADFSLQTPDMARGKNRNAEAHPSPLFPHWIYWMTAHAFIHGGVVALVTGSAWLGLAETVAHWLIDFWKCEGALNQHQDQAAHVGCKLLWWVI